MPLAFPSPSPGRQLLNGRWQCGGSGTGARRAAPPPQPRQALNWHRKKPTHPAQGRGGTAKRWKQAPAISPAGPPCLGSVGWRWLGRAGRSLVAGKSQLGEVPYIPTGPVVASAGTGHGQHSQQHPCGCLCCSWCCHSHNRRVKVPWETGRRNWKSTCFSFSWNLGYFWKQSQCQQQVKGCCVLSHVAVSWAPQAPSILALNERWGFHSNTCSMVPVLFLLLSLRSSP